MLDQIMIYDHNIGGGTTCFWLTNINSVYSDSKDDDHSKTLICMDEDDAQYLVEPYFKKWFNREYNTDNYMQLGVYDHYDSNFYPVEVVEKILWNIDSLITMLEQDDCNPAVFNEITLKAISWFLLAPGDVVADEKMKNRFWRNKLLFLDFYKRFVTSVRQLIKDNPDKRFFVGSGP